MRNQKVSDMQSQDLFGFTKKVHSTLPRELRDYVYEGLYDMPIAIMTFRKKPEQDPDLTSKPKEQCASLVDRQPQATSTSASAPCQIRGFIIRGHLFPTFFEELAARIATIHPTSEIRFSADVSTMMPSPETLEPYRCSLVSAYTYLERASHITPLFNAARQWAPTLQLLPSWALMLSRKSPCLSISVNVDTSVITVYEVEYPWGQCKSLLMSLNVRMGVIEVGRIPCV
ncbi:hypothetical protein K491DRAFT_674235 [Lophiostoma macrostomum CBS 122681]|uniref:Uncharacterized protein n=1 Tax=Lophiostoma macrostomum CBS 122681 TaxID=1314788 RepID=A0A6A6TNL9_9PLEO|nr:hypothetical protein K491DRAFT_674235 [Lophiostoma macrostomum CBS 122681]